MNTINRKKLNYLPVNILLSVPIFCMSIIVLLYVFKISLIPALIISVIEWFVDAHNGVETDYLQSQINDLKEKK